MHLFISYSHDDHPWVHELWRELMTEGHSPWIDRDIPPTADWWETICENIEQCECFVYVMTPKSVESIYCQGEMRYAVALNKPILPLMLKLAALPKELNDRRVHYQAVGDLNIDRVLTRIERGLGEVRVRKTKGEYKPKTVSRPDAPKPQKNAPEEHIFETFARAEEAAAEGKDTPAEQLFEQVIEADPDGLGLAARERLRVIRYERDRAKAYGNIVRLAESPVTAKGAEAAWQFYVQKYGADYDPERMVTRLNALLAPAVSASAAEGMPVLIVPAHSMIYHLLPKPFELITIPAGNLIAYGATEAVAEFYIAKYPLTNAQFRPFIEAGGYQQHRWWTDDGWRRRDKEGWSEPRYWQDDRWNQPTQPVVGVSWYEAVAYCMWLGAVSGQEVMLPTDLQWRRAAQGDDNRAFPWGADWDGANCNHSVYPATSSGTTSVTAYEGRGNSPYGVADLAGNIWEWSRTAHKSGANRINGTELRILRGGSWGMLEPNLFRISSRDWDMPHAVATYRGFRIACY